MATFTKVNPGDPIQAHQLDQIIDALIGTASAGVPIALTAVNDATNYALTVQNDESGNSRALNVLKSDGTTLIKADASGVTLGSPLNLPTNSITSAAIADQGVQNVDLGPYVARANLLTNGGFEIWQRGNGPFTSNYCADRWGVFNAGTDTFSVSRATSNNDPPGAVCAAVTFTLGTGGGASQIYQSLKNTDCPLYGQVVAFSARVKTSTANAVRIGVSTNGTGGVTAYSAFHPGDGAYHTLTVTLSTPGPDATTIQPGFYFAASCTAYLDNACLVSGSVPANYVPMHPADDLARCMRYYEKWIASTLANVLMAYGTAGAAREQLFPMVPKPTTPTITKVGTWTPSNISSINWDTNLDQAGLSHLLRVYGTIIATGEVTIGWNANEGIVAESNP